MFVNTKEHDLVKEKFDGRVYMKNLTDGFSYVKKDRVLIVFLALAVFLNAILVPINSLQAPLAGEVLGRGSEILSIFGIAMTAGMLLGSITYPMIKRVVSGKGLWMMSGLGIALFYIMLPVCRPLYTSAVIVYAITAFFSLLFGYTVALINSHLNVFVVKRVDQNYLARVGGIMEALGAASMPLASFIVSIFVAYVSTSAIFIASGVLAIIATICMLLSKTLGDDSKEKAEELPAAAMVSAE